MQVSIGSHAPDFTLASTSGSDVTLSNLRGKRVLLAFFPLAFTGVCTDEMCAFSQDDARFRDADSVVLPISVDSIPTLKEFKRKEGLTVDLLSDFKREVSRLYGTLLEEPFLSRRAYFLIDRAGVLRWSHIETDLGHHRPNDELLTRLATIE
ncbi:MAG: redoxin domain-containing protein [Gemmatimonadales bacterium]|nr:redoxin domain-containing protein [Gemmatimonadales bacterium]